MQKIIAAVIMILTLTVAGTAGAETWVLGETRPGLGQFGIGDTVTDPGTGTSVTIPAGAYAHCTFTGEHNVIRVIDKATNTDALSLAYLARYQQIVAGQPQLYGMLDDPGHYLVYRSITLSGTTTGQFILVVTGANYGGAVVDLDDPTVVRAFSATNVQVNGTVYGTPSAWAPSTLAEYEEYIDRESDPGIAESQGWDTLIGIAMADHVGLCQAIFTTPPAPPAAVPCADATTDLERGTCTGRETMTTEGRTGLIIGLEVY